MGSKYRAYPLTNLFDGKPETAWVFKGLPPRPEDYVRDYSSFWGGRYAVSIEFDKPARLDGVEIMNGYNKSPEIFYRNDRVGRLKVFEGAVFVNKGRIAAAALEDFMGFRKVAIPQRAYKALTLVFEDLIPGEERDLSITEIRFTFKGKPIDLRMPNDVLATFGSDCGCGTVYSVVDLSGKVIIREGGVSEGSTFSISPDGQFAAGLESCDGKTMVAWTVNLATTRVTNRKSLSFCEVPEDYVWKNGGVAIQRYERRYSAVRFKP